MLPLALFPALAVVLIAKMIGVLLSDLRIDQVGLRPVMIGIAVAYPIVPLCFLATPAFRGMDSPPRS